MREIAIIIEAILLMGLLYCLLNGAWLIIFDWGLGVKYKKVVLMMLVIVSCIALVFVIAHLTTFYPTI